VTDDAGQYRHVGRYFDHQTVAHSVDEYARYERNPDGSEYVIHTNTVEGYYLVFKRGMKGVYQHCSEKHLDRYLAEFDFRYSNRVALGVNDLMRAKIAAAGIKGKRLTYRRPHKVAHQKRIKREARRFLAWRTKRGA
jgi:hypothetical protein